MRVEQMVSEGDRVAAQLLMEGTHQGAWLGIPATNKRLQIRLFIFHRVVAGNDIVEDWVLVESLGVFQQLDCAGSGGVAGEVCDEGLRDSEPCHPRLGAKTKTRRTWGTL